MSLRVYQLQNAAELDATPWFDALKRSSAGRSDDADTVSSIIQDVRADGDEALVRYMRRWTDPDFTADRIVVKPKELTDALDALDPQLRTDLKNAIENVRTYQQHIRPDDPDPIQISGAQLRLRHTPIARVGLTVPGGRAAYPSSVIMLAVPAQVAGVPNDGLAIATPPPTRRGDEPAGDIPGLVLATCALVGVERVYRIGGAQAIAALAVGTESVSSVDFIAGPGNIYTQLAKQQVSGEIGIDGFYGPSEIVVIADESADASRVTSDLIAQAEHDPGRCFLVAWSRDVIDRINAELERQVTNAPRREAIQEALATGSAAILVDGPEQAAAVADRIAAEHVNLAVQDPEDWLGRLRNGGEFFLGDQTPVAAGDYWAGPSHCLPTGTTARFASGVSVHTFLKRSGVVCYPDGMPQKAVESIARLAEAEGLAAHASSVRARRNDT